MRGRRARGVQAKYTVLEILAPSPLVGEGVAEQRVIPN
jgi:hypothetical protein